MTTTTTTTTAADRLPLCCYINGTQSLIVQHLIAAHGLTEAEAANKLDALS